MKRLLLAIIFPAAVASAQVLVGGFTSSVITNTSDSSLGRYTATFTASTTWAVAASSHNFGSCDMVVYTFDSNLEEVQPGKVSCDSGTFDVTITWQAAQAGKLILLKAGSTAASGGAPSGAAGGDLSGSYPNPTIATVGGASASSVATAAGIAQTQRGTGTRVQMADSATPANNDCAKFDSAGRVTSAGGPCNTGSGGDASTSISSSTDGQMAIFDGSGGKTIKAADFTGVVRVVAGVAQAVTGTATDCVRVNGTSGPCGSGETGGLEPLGVGLDRTTGPLRVNPGTMRGHTYFVASLTFGTIAQSACATQTITVTGALVGDTVSAAWPHTLEAGLIGNMIVTASNTVTVRLCKITSGSSAGFTTNFAGELGKSL